MFFKRAIAVFLLASFLVSLSSGTALEVAPSAKDVVESGSKYSSYIDSLTIEELEKLVADYKADSLATHEHDRNIIQFIFDSAIEDGIVTIYEEYRLCLLLNMFYDDCASILANDIATSRSTAYSYEKDNEVWTEIKSSTIRSPISRSADFYSTVDSLLNIISDSRKNPDTLNANNIKMFSDLLQSITDTKVDMMNSEAGLGYFEALIDYRKQNQ